MVMQIIRIFIFISLFFINASNTFAQKKDKEEKKDKETSIKQDNKGLRLDKLIAYKKTQNGIVVCGSSSFLFQSGFGGVTQVFFNLELYTDGKSKQYAIKMKLNPLANNEYDLLFPASSLLLLKLSDDSILELKSAFRRVGDDKIFGSASAKMNEAIFPIEEEQLKSLFTGVKKLRVNIMFADPKTKLPDLDLKKEYKEHEFDKKVVTKLGENFSNWYQSVNYEFEQNGMNIIEKGEKKKDKSNIHEGF